MLSLLHHPGLFLEFLLLLHSVPVDHVKGVFVRDNPVLHVHVVYLVTAVRILNGPPWLRHWRLQTLHRNPQQILVRVDI
jgi:hypothetical protein